MKSLKSIQFEEHFRPSECLQSSGLNFLQQNPGSCYLLRADSDGVKYGVLQPSSLQRTDPNCPTACSINIVGGAVGWGGGNNAGVLADESPSRVVVTVVYQYIM